MITYQDTADPAHAPPLAPSLGPMALAGPSIDAELASIPVPRSFDDLNLNPAKDILQKGAQFMRQGQWDDAIKAFYEALKLAPSSDLAYESLGQCYLSKNELSKAIANLDSAIRLNPKSASAYVARANANVKLRFLQRALQRSRYGRQARTKKHLRANLAIHRLSERRPSARSSGRLYLPCSS